MSHGNMNLSAALVGILQDASVIRNSHQKRLEETIGYHLAIAWVFPCLVHYLATATLNPKPARKSSKHSSRFYTVTNNLRSRA